MTSFSDLLWLDVCQNWRKIKSNQQNWTDVRFNYYSTAYWNWKGKEEVYKCPSASPNFYCLRKFLSSEIYIPSDIFCGNEDFII